MRNSAPQKGERQPARRASAGYTLVELLVVLVLIVLAASLVIPATARAFANFQMRLAARSMAVLWGQARSHALFEGHPCLVVFAPADRSGRKMIVERDDGRQIDQLSLPPGISLQGQRGDGNWTGDLQPLWFFPDGTSEALQLDLRDALGSHIQLELAPLTGKVRVSQMYKGD